MSGPRPGGQGRQWFQRPLRSDHLDARQETQAGDQDQEKDPEPSVERNILL